MLADQRRDTLCAEHVESAIVLQSILGVVAARELLELRGVSEDVINRIMTSEPSQRRKRSNSLTR